MEIRKISYRTYQWATTNPPINSSSELLLEKSENGWALYDISELNGSIMKKTYAVSEAHADRIIGLFYELDIRGEFFVENPNKAENYPMMGGGSGASVSAQTDSEELSTAFFTEKMSEFINRFCALKNECGNPIKTEGELPQIFFGAPATASSVNIPLTDSEPQKKGEWICPLCGYNHNTGNFCSECGSVKNNY